jgi:hypothetical protein
MARSLWLSGLLVLVCGVGGWSVGSMRGGEAAEVNPLQNDRRERPRPMGRDRSAPSVEPMKELLANLSPDAEEGKVWRIVQRLNPEEIRGAIKEITGRERRTAYKTWLSALYYRWSETDPMAALESARLLKGDFLAEEMGLAVLCSWMSRDAEGAYLSLKKDKDFSHEARDILVRTWNKDNIFDNLKRFPDKEDARILLGAYCFESAGDPESRTQMLAALDANEDLTGREWAYSLLFRSWLYKDAAGALAAVAEKPIPWLQQQMLRDGMNNQPGPTLKWATERGLRPGESMWQEGYRHWLMFEPEEARGWFTTQIPAWNERGDHRAVADFITQEIDNAQVPKDDPIHRQLDERLARQMEVWRNHDPAAADAWLAAKKKKSTESTAN